MMTTPTRRTARKTSETSDAATTSHEENEVKDKVIQNEETSHSKPQASVTSGALKVELDTLCATLVEIIHDAQGANILSELIRDDATLWVQQFEIVVKSAGSSPQELRAAIESYVAKWHGHGLSGEDAPSMCSGVVFGKGPTVEVSTWVMELEEAIKRSTLLHLGDVSLFRIRMAIEEYVVPRLQQVWISR